MLTRKDYVSFSPGLKIYICLAEIGEKTVELSFMWDCMYNTENKIHLES